MNRIDQFIRHTNYIASVHRTKNTITSHITALNLTSKRQHARKDRTTGTRVTFSLWSPIVLLLKNHIYASP